MVLCNYCFRACQLLVGITALQDTLIGVEEKKGAKFPQC